MKFSQDNMKAATDLTKSGKLLEATRLIQKMLSGGSSASQQDLNVSLWQQTRLPPSMYLGVDVPKRTPTPLKTAKINISAFDEREQTQFEIKRFSCELGERAYKLFVPSSYAAKPLPLVVMLHGCTQTPDDFANGTRMNELAEEMGFFVAYPAQSPSANAMGCWNWFKISDQQRGTGEPALIAGIAHQILVDYAVDAKRVYVAGLSAGGAMAAVLGMTYPDLFAAVGVHSGLACNAATDLASALHAMKRGGHPSKGARSSSRVPAIVFHGDKDRTVHPLNADAVLTQFDHAINPNAYQTISDTSCGGLSYSKSVFFSENEVPQFERWMVHGAGHAWSGGSLTGSYVEPRGPDASREMIRFFLQHKLGH